MPSTTLDRKAAREVSIRNRRLFRVDGWESTDHSPEEIAGIQRYLETGNKDGLPKQYKERTNPGAKALRKMMQRDAEPETVAGSESDTTDVDDVHQAAVLDETPVVVDETADGDPTTVTEAPSDPPARRAGRGQR
jgi:hypothetical protein